MRFAVIVLLALASGPLVAPCKAEESSVSPRPWFAKVLRFFGAGEPLDRPHVPFMRLVNDGRPFLLHAFPSENSRVTARLHPPTRFVQRIGQCTQSWCRVRLGAAVGWLSRDRMAGDGSTEQPAAPPPPEHSIQPALQTADRDRVREVAIALPVRRPAIPAAPRPPVLPESIPTAATSEDAPLKVTNIEPKTYALNGLTDEMFLPVREDHDENARILGRIPFFADDVEALGLCIDDWCLIRRDRLRGWLKRDRLTDAPRTSEPRLQLVGLTSSRPLNIYDEPSEAAKIVGKIHPPATGIRPSARCNERWCNIRYFGTVGWVHSENLTPQ